MARKFADATGIAELWSKVKDYSDSKRVTYFATGRYDLGLISIYLYDIPTFTEDAIINVAFNQNSVKVSTSMTARFYDKDDTSTVIKSCTLATVAETSLHIQNRMLQFYYRYNSDNQTGYLYYEGEAQATTSVSGTTLLSTSTSSTATDRAATSSAVKAAYDLANGKQDALVSGANIKTVNNESLLGSGNITITGGGAQRIWYGTCSTSPYTAAKVVTTTSGDFVLEDGSTIIVYFTAGNMATSQMTLDVDGTGAEDVGISPDLCATTYNSPIMFVYSEDVEAFYAVNRFKASTTRYGLSVLPIVTQVSITVADWNATTTVTKSVTGVTASNNITVSPAPSSISDYVSAGVYCSAQASGTLTFECTSTPTADLVVNVKIEG